MIKMPAVCNKCKVVVNAPYLELFESCGDLCMTCYQKEKESFKPCSNRYWHHQGTTCKVCGQKG